jgi:signal transduction histidine kinase
MLAVLRKNMKMQKQRETLKLKLISLMTLMTMMLARVKEIMKKTENQPSKMLENQPNIPSLMR